jgi:hypothetical protein
LRSDNPAIVLQALDNLKKLTCDDSGKNLKQILSIAGHMRILATLKKHMRDTKIITGALYVLYKFMIDGSNVNVGCTLLSWCNQGNLEGNGGGQ